MKSYSEQDIFSDRELDLLRHAIQLVERVQAKPDLRCHELARAIGRVLNLPHQDGFYCFVDHTWLWTEERAEYHPWLLPNIIDVYAVGSLPQVRLVDMQHPGCGHVQLYRFDKPRTDIDESLVAQLVSHLEWLERP
jgi:hypothetical protein